MYGVVFCGKSWRSKRRAGARHRQTRLLQADEPVESGQIALFSPLKTDFQGTRGRFVRFSALKLENGIVPSWVLATPFRVAIIRLEKLERGKRNSCIETALENVVNGYTRWFSKDQRYEVPWCTSRRDPSVASSHWERLASWVGNSETLRSLIVIVKKPENEIQTVQINQWQVNYSRKPVIFPALAVRQGLEFLKSWEQSFPREDTWARNQFNIPSLFVRFDCIVRDGQLIVYEIEERPAGLGLTSRVNGEFAVELKAMAKLWPEFRVEISPLRSGTDDHLWLHLLPKSAAGSDLVLVRAEPEETEFHHLEAASVSSLKSKGDKGYGVKMGFWSRVATAEELPWDSCFVLKPLQGSKLKDLEIWDPEWRPGSSVRAKIIEAMSKNSGMFLQHLHPPMDTGIKQFPWMIFRVFFGYDPGSREWRCLGGNWNARHNLRIHGALDAIFGPAVVE